MTHPTNTVLTGRELHELLHSLPTWPANLIDWAVEVQRAVIERLGATDAVNEREEFEAWAKGYGYQRDELARSKLGLVSPEYFNDNTESAWQAWLFRAGIFTTALAQDRQRGYEAARAEIADDHAASASRARSSYLVCITHPLGCAYCARSDTRGTGS